MAVKNKMNAKVKAKWVEALRSGKYKQATGALRETLDEPVFDDNDEVSKAGKYAYCCLGVLCEVYAARRGISEEFDEDGWFGGEQSYPPKEVKEWAGLDGLEVEVEDDAVGAIDHLATLNDKGGLSFKKIATWVEKNL